MGQRVEFLRSFLGALGAQELLISEEENDRVCGTVVYDPMDREERQDFCWRATEAESPREEICRLAEILREEKILDSDRIPLSLDELRSHYNCKYETTLDLSQFNIIAMALMQIRVRMIDNGEETDSYLIHTCDYPPVFVPG